MGLLAQWRARSTAARVRLGHELRAAYLDARRLAAQLRRHAGHVPYPAQGPVLARLAEQAEEAAALLADELRALAGNTDPSDSVAPRDGRNHWERLGADLETLEALQRRYADLVLHFDVDFPATIAAVERLAQTTAAMTSGVRDLLARSDPHAAN